MSKPTRFLGIHDTEQFYYVVYHYPFYFHPFYFHTLHANMQNKIFLLFFLFLYFLSFSGSCPNGQQIYILGSTRDDLPQVLEPTLLPYKIEGLYFLLQTANHRQSRYKTNSIKITTIKYEPEILLSAYYKTYLSMIPVMQSNTSI